MSFSKYRAKPTHLDGHRFASKAESRRYSELKSLQQAGLISHLELQPTFFFKIDGKLVVSRSDKYPKGRPLKMVADFKYLDTKTGKVVWEDKKGFRTREFILKKAFFEAISGFELVET